MSEIDQSFLQRYPFLAIILALILYGIALVAPILIANVLKIEYPLRFLISFSCLVVVWFIIVPFVLHLPNGREPFVDYLNSIHLNRIQPLARNLFLGVSISVILFVCFFISVFLTGLWTLDFGYILPPTSWSLLYSINPGVFEEICFRGFILVLLLKKYDERTSIFLSAVIFGIAHSVNIFFGASVLDTITQLGYAFFAGLFLGYLFVKTKSLLPGIVIHYSIDGLGPIFLHPLFEAGVDPGLRAVVMLIGVGIVPCVIIIPLLKVISERWSLESKIPKTP